MLRTMRAPDGGPALRTRMVALLLAVGMLLISGPALIPILHWVVGRLI